VLERDQRPEQQHRAAQDQDGRGDFADDEKTLEAPAAGRRPPVGHE